MDVRAGQVGAAILVCALSVRRASTRGSLLPLLRLERARQGAQGHGACATEQFAS